MSRILPPFMCMVSPQIAAELWHGARSRRDHEPVKSDQIFVKKREQTELAASPAAA